MNKWAFWKKTWWTEGFCDEEKIKQWHFPVLLGGCVAFVMGLTFITESLTRDFLLYLPTSNTVILIYGIIITILGLVLLAIFSWYFTKLNYKKK